MSAGAIHWKQNHAPGLRCFGSLKAAEHGGADPATLVSAGGLLIQWPAGLGTPPTDSDVAQWETEYQEHVDVEKKRLAAVRAMSTKILEDALNDPNAPQEVKDYKAVKKL